MVDGRSALLAAEEAKRRRQHLPKERSIQTIMPQATPRQLDRVGNNRRNYSPMTSQTTSPTRPPDEDHGDDHVTLETELVRRALTLLANSQCRGSVSPVYSACTQSFIRLFAKEVVSPSHLHGRPETKVLQAAGKAVNLLEQALEELHPQWA